MAQTEGNLIETTLTTGTPTTNAPKEAVVAIKGQTAKTYQYKVHKNDAEGYHLALAKSYAECTVKEDSTNCLSDFIKSTNKLVKLEGNDFAINLDNTEAYQHTLIQMSNIYQCIQKQQGTNIDFNQALVECNYKSLLNDMFFDF